MPQALQNTDLFIVRSDTKKRYDDDCVIFTNPPTGMRNVWTRQALNVALSGNSKLSDPVTFKNENGSNALYYKGVLINALSDNGISIQSDLSKDFEVIKKTETLTISPSKERMYLVKIAKYFNPNTKLEEISDKLKAGSDKLSVTIDQISSISKDLTVEIFNIEYGGKVSNNTSNGKGRFISDYYVDASFDDIFDVLAPKTFADGRFLNIWLCGPSGYGKTSIIEQLAAYLKKPVVQVNCAVMQNSEQWFGRTRVVNGDTIFDPTSFTEAVRAGNCIIILDEANRCDPEVSNSLLPLLDHRQETEVNGMKIKAGKGIVYALTTNIGPQYAGVSALDAAFINRCHIRVNVGAMSFENEISLLQRSYPTVHTDMIKWLSNVCQTLRKLFTSENEPDFQYIDVDVSTRTLLNMGMLANYGLDKNSIVNYTVFNHLTPDIQVKVKDRLKLVVGNF